MGPAWAQFQRHGTLSASFNDAAGVHADPSFSLRGLWTKVEGAESWVRRLPGRISILERTPWQVRRPAPSLGEHNSDVYAGMLGYNRRELSMLRQMGVI